MAPVGACGVDGRDLRKGRGQYNARMAHPEPRDLDRDRERLVRFLEARRPGAEGLVVDELRAPSNTGFSSETLMFTVRWRERGAAREERLVARVEPKGFNVFPTYDLTVQYRVMDALAKTPVPVPAMREHDWSGDALGASFYLMEFLDGWVPSDNPPMHAAGHIAEELAPAEREQVWWSGVEAMCRVHDVDAGALGLGFLDEPERGPDALAQQLHYWDAYLSWGLGQRGRYPLLERALAWLRDRAPAGEPVGLCWGDSRLANQIFAGVECMGVLDWEMVRLGNPLQDLAWWVALDRCFTEGVGLARLPGLPGRDETLAHWSRRTGRALDALDFYEVLALMKFGAIMARLGRQLKHYEILPPDHEMDVSNLASVTLARKLDEMGIPA